jgi:cbb3-type cytochrome oxidase subunit 3
MDWVDWAYLVFGGALVAVFACIVFYYYKPRRKRHVEEPKYRMLDDD